MGTADFSVSKGNKSRGNGSPTVLSSHVRTSGAFTTSTTADDLADAAADVTLSAGEILQVYADEAMRLNFGGVAATAIVGHYIPATTQREFECEHPGKVSIIDVA